MKRLCFPVLLCLLLLLTGCSRQSLDTEPLPQEETLPAATVPEDGDPDTVTCKGSYTGQKNADLVAARVDNAILTNRELRVWYWAEVAQYRQSQAQPAPDFSQPLDRQSCPLDDTLFTWQQYFLKCALNRWHTAQALIRHSLCEPFTTEEAYDPDLSKLHRYMDGMPATRFLYGYQTFYQPNTLHQAYLDTIEENPETLGITAAAAEEAFGSSVEAMQKYVRDLNYAYMYFTELTYDPEMEETAVSVEFSQPRVDFRQILLLKDQDTSLIECLTQANTLLNQWRRAKGASGDTFAQLASLHSQDAGSAPNGGLYRNASREQLPLPIADWCFDPSRQKGDVTIITGNRSVHILYFLNRNTSVQVPGQTALLDRIRELYPMETDYYSINLTGAAGTISVSDLLYPDIAHQRYPEIPLYLQQSYPHTMYGDYPLISNGCGATSLAMMASYMTDEELTPPEMSARYGSFSRSTGTDGSLFEKAPPQLGFYLIKKTYDWREARDYMQQGCPVVVVQYSGYWTSGGHYLVLEEISDDGRVRVRDSNMFNYEKLRRHQDDLFPWSTIVDAGMGYWIYQPKAVSTAACTRCGDPETLDFTTVRDYICPKCQTALLRRNIYLS